MKNILTTILVLFTFSLSAQRITSNATVLYPGTDSCIVVSDTVTVTINSKSGTVVFSHTVETVTYKIRSTTKGVGFTRYYLDRYIYYVEIRSDEIRVAFTNAPMQPILLVALVRR